MRAFLPRFLAAMTLQLLLLTGLALVLLRISWHCSMTSRCLMSCARNRRQSRVWESVAFLPHKKLPSQSGSACVILQRHGNVVNASFLPEDSSKDTHPHGPERQEMSHWSDDFL